MNFIGTSNRFIVFDSPFKAQHRIYAVDLETKEVKWIDFLNKSGVDALHGDYELQRVYKDTLIIRFSAFNQPTQIYSMTFRSCSSASLSELLNNENLSVKLLEDVSFNQDD